MRDAVTHSYGLGPRDLGMVGCEFRILANYVAGCFANNLYVAHYRILHERLRLEGGEIHPCCVFADASDCFEQMA